MLSSHIMGCGGTRNDNGKMLEMQEEGKQITKRYILHNHSFVKMKIATIVCTHPCACDKKRWEESTVTNSLWLRLSRGSTDRLYLSHSASVRLNLTSREILPF